MSLFSYELEQRLLTDYETRMRYFSVAKAEVDAYLTQLNDREHRLSLICMYAYMPESDIISYSPDLIDSFVVSSLKTRDIIPYCANITPIDFLTYVMCYRINNENIEDYRDSFFKELYPRVQGLSIMEAALEVNYWCFEKATYAAADGRTASPLTTIRRTRGRCGEESTLCAAALRSVGIPARQIYVPWWAHTESNHAWVEFQTENGEWHFLGACEPEAVPDKGWFTVPGTRSMNMIARAYTKLLSGDNVLDVTPISQFINCTSHYAPVTRLTIKVTENGKPKAGIFITLKVANWHHLVPLHFDKTDENGVFSIEVGMGSLIVHVTDKVRMIERLIHTKNCTYLEIPFEEAVDLNEIGNDKVEYLTLTPPPAIPDKDYGITAEVLTKHEKRIKDSEAIRLAYEATFQTKDSFIQHNKTLLSETDIAVLRNMERDYIAEARGNHEIIQQFLLSKQFSMEEKVLLLDSMQEKDMVDAQLPTLLHTLETSLPFRNQYPSDIFEEYLLSPRIGFAMIEDNRIPLKHFAEEHNIPTNGMAIWNFLKDYISILPKEASGSRHLGSPLGALKNRTCSENTFDLLFVSLCRAVGIPARMGHGDFSYYENDTFIVPDKVTDTQLTEIEYTVTLCFPDNKPLHFFRDFIIEKYEDGDFGFAPMMPPRRMKKDIPPQYDATLKLSAGYYRIVRMKRDEDGTAHLVFNNFSLHGNREVQVPNLDKQYNFQWLNYKPENGTLCKLYPIESTNYTNDEQFLDILATYNLKNHTKNICSVWMILNPGKEPTEHILNEMRSNQEAFKRANCKFNILLSDVSELANPTLQMTLQTMPILTVHLGNELLFEQLFKAEPNKDIRLPFIAFIDYNGVIRYTWTGYRIGTAEQILEVFETFVK